MAAILTQANRQFKVSTPLGKDVLLFGHMSASEQLSGLYKIDLNLFSTNKAIKPEQILGAPVSVSIELPEAKGERHFHGHVAEFAYVEPIGEIHAYRATLRPWLWFLTRSADCRIFQNKNVPDIIKTVFRDLGFTDFKDGLSRSYEPWEYCVQYRETAFDFVSRLMEHEGIYYYFEHTASKHSLVLTDSTTRIRRSPATTACLITRPSRPDGASAITFRNGGLPGRCRAASTATPTMISRSRRWTSAPM